jgi:nitroreductase family protein
LIEALRLRRSIREYSEQPLPPQVLSDLLWAAFGINRPSGDRTAPYWRHIMVIDVPQWRMGSGCTIQNSTLCCLT